MEDLLIHFHSLFSLNWSTHLFLKVVIQFRMVLKFIACCVVRRTSPDCTCRLKLWMIDARNDSIFSIHLHKKDIIRGQYSIKLSTHSLIRIIFTITIYLLSELLGIFHSIKLNHLSLEDFLGVNFFTSGRPIDPLALSMNHMHTLL